jgi:hypothetical protein
MLIPRLAAVTIAAVTALLLLIGDHPAEFVVADLLVVALLVVAAVVPMDRGAVVALAIAFGAGLGVFTVAFAAELSDGAMNWPLGIAVIACVAGIALSWRQYAGQRGVMP